MEALTYRPTNKVVSLKVMSTIQLTPTFCARRRCSELTIHVAFRV